MRELISNAKWYVRGVWPHIPISEKSRRNMDCYYVTDRIEATVPGGIHYDLFRTGVIENPYYADNSFKCEWTERRWWLYETDIKIDSTLGKKIYLVFEGLDYGADIFVNGVPVGSHENMFTTARYDITDAVSEDTNVKVLLRGAPSELGQYGRTSMTSTQKSRFGYGWDFATKLVNIGIWKDVWVEYAEAVELTEAKITSDLAEGKGIIRTAFAFFGSTEETVNIQIISPDGKREVADALPFSEWVQRDFTIEAPEIWYPNGMGAHPLYKVCVQCGEVKKEYRIGIRSLRYVQNTGAPEESLPYTVVINGERVQLKGNNKVPLDHLYGNVDRAAYEWYVRALVNENANIVRLWGGGIIEKEIFYDLCDENGILIWQDFIQSSSGYENVPSKQEGFLQKLRDMAVEAVKEKRNHVSLTFWCGGNELTDEEDLPAKYEDANIAILGEIVKKEDPERLFLSSTPSGPVYRLDFERLDNHDVHGPWGYLGKHEFYEKYNKLRLLLHSEVGIPGPASAIPEFMDTDCLQDSSYIKRRHHGGFWWHSYETNQDLFGDFDSYQEYVPYGQWIQAEGLRYTVESDQRLGKYNSGTMIWQLNEPWPNSDCTNLVDYFGTPKMAYYWVKKAFAECGASLKYDSIVSGEQFRAVLCRDTGKAPEEIVVDYYSLEGVCLERQEYQADQLPVTLERDMQDAGEVFFVRISCGGAEKDYFFSKSEELPYASVRRMEKEELNVKLGAVAASGSSLHGAGLTANEEIMTLQAIVKNTGSAAALFVHPFDKTGQYAILSEDAYFTLLPGEEKTIALTLRKRLGLFFERKDVRPEIIFEGLNC